MIKTAAHKLRILQFFPSFQEDIEELDSHKYHPGGSALAFATSSSCKERLGSASLRTRSFDSVAFS